MLRKYYVTAVALLVIGGTGCSSGESGGTGGSPGSGGSTATGGGAGQTSTGTGGSATGGTGGSSANGGNSGTGGLATGGTPGTGVQPGTGGQAGSGTGGRQQTGGTTGSGGAAGAGGAGGQAGRGGAAGSVSSGGKGGGGSTGTGGGTGGSAGAPAVAATPPMGWNSWNTFGCSPSESLVKGVADTFVSSGMAAVGYQYVNIDDCWMSGRDSSGNLQWDTSKFPSGIPALATYVHGKGLKLGIYETPYSTTCAGKTGGANHQTQDANSFASWGVDYLKYDDCQGPLTAFATMHDALVATGRPIFYSINPVYGADRK